MNKVGAVIVTYNPKVGLKKRVDLILSQVCFIVIIDNSDSKAINVELDELEHESRSVSVFRNNENMGMARALNQGCARLYDKGFNQALLMDQDSTLTTGMVKVLREHSEQDEKCGIIGPLIFPEGIELNAIKSKLRFVKKIPPFFFARISPLDVPFQVAFNITSGSLCDLAIWNELGGFWEDLFIDGVDNEYGLRLLSRGYRTLIHPGAVLYQNYGMQRRVHFLGKNYFPTFHGGSRRYYAARNRVLIWKRYCFSQPFYLVWDFLSFINTLKLILLFEDNKAKKIFYILIGLKDGFLNRRGRFDG